MCWRWVKKKSRLHEDIRVHNEMVKTSILVDDLEADPIGIGTDNFLINEGFMIMVSLDKKNSQMRGKYLS